MNKYSYEKLFDLDDEMLEHRKYSRQLSGSEID